MAKTNIQISAGALPAADILTNEQITTLLPHLDNLISWAKQVQDYALKKALEGVKFEGYKVVAGKSNRKFKDEDAVAELLLGEGYDENIIYEKKLATLSKIETLVGKKKFPTLMGDLVVKPLGRPCMVLETDPREEYTPEASAADDFKDVVEDY